MLFATEVAGTQGRVEQSTTTKKCEEAGEFADRMP